MKVIHKYTLDTIIGSGKVFEEGHKIVVPFGTNFLSTQFHKHELCVLAEVDIEENTYSVFVFKVIDIGQKVPEGYTYLGTVQGDSFVWLVYYNCSVFRQ